MRKIVGIALLACGLYGAELDDATRRLGREVFRELIEINTTDSAGSTTVAAEAMARRLLEAGFPAGDVQVLGPNDRKGNLVARLRGTGAGGPKPILLIGHLDVVEALRKDWTSDPFRFEEKDGYFYGRGTQDMKNNDAALVTAFVRMRQEGYRPDRDLILALTADEEGGKSNGVDWLLKNHRELVDCGYVLNADSGGILTVKGKVVTIGVEATEKTYADFQLTATNPGGHSSLPLPDNAIYHIAGALGRLAGRPFPFELNPVTREYFRRRAERETGQLAADMKAILGAKPDAAAMARLSKDAYFNSTMRTTCVATRLNAGHANNAMPQTAQAIVNCRILPGHSPEEVRQQLIALFADPKVAVDYVSGTGAVEGRGPDAKGFTPIAPSAEILKPLEKIADGMWPGAPVLPVMETGASDSIYTAAAGIPTYGISGMALDQDDVRAHGKDERIRVSSFDDGVEFYYRYLKALTAGN